MQTPVVVRLEWSSLDGRVEFRPVYDDGSVGREIVRTDLMLGVGGRNFAVNLAAIERDWIRRQKS